MPRQKKSLLKPSQEAKTLFSKKNENQGEFSLFWREPNRVVPHMDQMDRVLPYLAELGALHERQGIARWTRIIWQIGFLMFNFCMAVLTISARQWHLHRHHLDLLGMAYCFALRGVVQVSSRCSNSVGVGQILGPGDIRDKVITDWQSWSLRWVAN